MNLISVVFVLALCKLSSSVAVPYRVSFEGKCPVVKFVDDFDSSKFVGKWYAVKETGREVPCVSYELEETRSNHYHAYVKPANFTIEFDKKNVEDYADGLSVKIARNPYMNGGELKIFATDYGEDDCEFIANLKPELSHFYSQLCWRLHLQGVG